MTRPTAFVNPFPQGVGGIGGDPSLPPGQPPVDCCDDETEVPDRAFDQTVFVGLQGGNGDLVQWDSDTFNGTMASLAYPGDTVAGNLLVAVLIDRGGGVTPTAPTGWTFVNNGGESDPDEGTMFWRVAPGGATSFTITSGPTNEQRLYIMEFDGGAAGLLDTTRVQAGGSTTTFTVPAVTVASDAILVGDVLGSTFPSDLTYTEDPDFTNVDQGRCGGGLEPDSNVGYRIVTAGTYDYAPTGSGATAYGGVLAAFSLLAGDTWIGGGPNITDGDDATYQEITGENVVRIWLGDAFAIARVRLLIGTETSGAKSYTLKGANAADFSDAVTVATLDWTATGSFTADEVLESWAVTDSYEFWELTGDDETRYVYSFELYEAGASDASAVQANLDDHLTDAVDAHDASAVSIVDSGSYFTGTDVEAALQELGADTGSSIYFNVVDYGAVGDDTTDDTVAIQAAADAAIAVRGTVFFPATVDAYKITATIVLDHDVSLMGEGGAGNNSGPVVRMATSNTTAFRGTSNAYDITFKSLFIKGPGGNSSGSGIYGNDRNVHTTNVRIEGFYYGLRIGGQAYYSKQFQSMFHDNDNANVWLEAGVNNVEFYACRINLGVYGIKADGVHGIRVYGGSIETNTYGVYGTGGNHAWVLSGVYFEANATSDVYLGVSTADQAALIEGCLFTTLSTTRSIDTNLLDRLTIIGCFFDPAFPAGDDIRTQSASTYVLLGNNEYSGAGVSFAGPVIDLDPSDTTTASAVGNAGSHGSSKYLAPIDHVHALGGTVAGDLSGTLPNPTVAKVNGVAVTGTPAVGDHIVATSSSAATWQTPATPSSGGVTDHEHIVNVVFSGDASATVWELPAAPVSADAIAVYIAGSRSLAWVLSGDMLTTLTFDSAPASATNNIVIDIVAATA